MGLKQFFGLSRRPPSSDWHEQVPRSTVVDGSPEPCSAKGLSTADAPCDSAALLNALPPPPARVLLVGTNLAALVVVLRTNGYTVAEIGTLTATEFLAYSVSQPGGYQAVVLGELSSRLDSLTAMTGCYDVLTAGGRLLILAAAARYLAKVAPQGLDPAEYFTKMVGRYGFSPLTQPVLAGTSGIFGFVKRGGLRWRLGVVREQDMPSVLGLFCKVFGHDMTPALWHWKYGEGRGCGTMARRGDVLVAHYGGIARRILFFGEPELTFQISDVMVDTEERAVLTKSGPFFLTAAAFPEVYRASPLSGFGFPSQRPMRVAERTGLYTEVGRMVEIRWAPSPDRPRFGSCVRQLPARFGPSERDLIDGLWGGMRNDLKDAIVGVRDAQYIQHRYLDHPHHHYDILMVTNRWTREPYGVIVLRRHVGKCEMLDMIAPLKNVPSLVNQARRMSSRWGMTELYCWITHQHTPLFTRTGGNVHPLDICIPASSWVAGPPIEFIKDKWWLMAGDTDFR